MRTVYAASLAKRGFTGPKGLFEGPEEQLRAGLTRAGLPVEVVNIAISIRASFAAGAFDIVTGDVERLGGRPPKPLCDVLAGAVKFPSA